jgi:hypothetical protein
MCADAVSQIRLAGLIQLRRDAFEQVRLGAANQ